MTAGMLRRAAWLCLPLLALVEVGAHAFIRHRVPEEAEFTAAAAFVTERWRPGDAVAIAPAWADPILRRHMGDKITLAMAGRSDLDAYRRLWVLSIRGAQSPEAHGQPAGDPTVFGEVSVAQHALPAPNVTYAFVDHALQATASHVGRGRERPCKLRKTNPGRGGGLGHAVVVPRERFDCPGHNRRRFIAPLVLEDLSLQPRHCIYQPVHAGGATRLRFDDVPLDGELVFYGGLYYEDERAQQGAPVHIRLLADGRELATLTHSDGDGWKRYAVPTTPGRASVSVEVDAKSARRRGFCWSASVRSTRP